MEDHKRPYGKACLQCRTSKIKCDNKRPCTRCIRKGEPLQCQDVPCSGLKKKCGVSPVDLAKIIENTSLCKAVVLGEGVTYDQGIEKTQTLKEEEKKKEQPEKGNDKTLHEAVRDLQASNRQLEGQLNKLLNLLYQKEAAAHSWYYNTLTSRTGTYMITRWRFATTSLLEYNLEFQSLMRLPPFVLNHGFMCREIFKEKYYELVYQVCKTLATGTIRSVAIYQKYIDANNREVPVQTELHAAMPWELEQPEALALPPSSNPSILPSPFMVTMISRPLSKSQAAMLRNEDYFVPYKITVLNLEEVPSHLRMGYTASQQSMPLLRCDPLVSPYSSPSYVPVVSKATSLEAHEAKVQVLEEPTIEVSKSLQHHS